MKKLLFAGMLVILFVCRAETLFEVKDSANKKVLDVSTDGLRIMNDGDTLMVISPSGVRVNLDNSSTKVLSRTFAVTTTSSKRKGLTNVLEVGTASTMMREGIYGDEYTNFSPQNLFLGINAGTNTVPSGTYGMNNVFLGNSSGVLNYDGRDNIFIGFNTGYNNINTNDNIFIGNYAGYNTQSDEAASQYGCENVFIGSRSGYSNIDGLDNVCIGNKTGEDNTGGTGNVFIGGFAGNSSKTSNNVLVGGAVMYQNTTGMHNTALGTEAGTFNITGSGNIFLGYEAGYNETGSNKLYIENSNSSTPLIYGDFSTDYIKINGNLDAVDITPTSDTPALYGIHNVTNFYGVGVRGDGGYKGVVGYASATTGEIRGVEGIASGTGGTKIGIYGSANSGTTNWAGFFSGDINVTGTVVKSKEEVKVDHPLDPENKYLVHSGVISDKMTNMYNGSVMLDSEGKAEVILPQWFEAMNTDYLYQLTAVGKPGPNLYISEEIKNNRFEIAGGSPNMKVSWMVTGTRNDNFAKANQVEIEEKKNPTEKGYYLHPEAYGLPKERGIEFQTEKKMKEKQNN